MMMLPCHEQDYRLDGRGGQQTSVLAPINIFDSQNRNFAASKWPPGSSVISVRMAAMPLPGTFDDGLQIPKPRLPAQFTPNFFRAGD